MNLFILFETAEETEDNKFHVSEKGFRLCFEI